MSKAVQGNGVEEGQGKNTEGSIKKCKVEVGMGRQIKGGVSLAREGQQ